jgi:AcrR family transcriptional regulator
MDKRGKKSGGAAPDRRVGKTKKLLSDALVSLILEKGYEKATITDILTRADVGRSTFYLHFENKEQLLLWGHEHLKKLILEDGEDRIGFLAFYRHLADSGKLAKAVLSQKSGAIVLGYLDGIFQRNILRLHPAAKIAGEERAMHALRVAAAAAALTRLIADWVGKGMPYPPERMARESLAWLENAFGKETRDSSRA